MPNPQNSNRPAATARAPRTWDFGETTFCRFHRLRRLCTHGGTWRLPHFSHDAGWCAETQSARNFRNCWRRGVGWRRLDYRVPAHSCRAVGGYPYGGPRVRRISGAELAAPQRDGLAFAAAAGGSWQLNRCLCLPSHQPHSPVVAGGATGLFVLLVGGCLAGPIMEEFVFRGFMFRGCSESFLGPVGAIVLTSALFGAYHTQYDVLGRFWVFLIRMILCTFRRRSNSTWLTAVVHSAVNIVLLFLSGPYV